MQYYTCFSRWIIPYRFSTRLYILHIDTHQHHNIHSQLTLCSIDALHERNLSLVLHFLPSRSLSFFVHSLFRFVISFLLVLALTRVRSAHTTHSVRAHSVLAHVFIFCCFVSFSKKLSIQSGFSCYGMRSSVLLALYLSLYEYEYTQAYVLCLCVSVCIHTRVRMLLSTSTKMLLVT